MYARNRIPMYEGDGIIRQGPTADTPPDSPENLPEPLSREHIERKARKPGRRLGELLAWIRRKLQSNNPLEDYLSRASSLADVERLLRKAETDRHLFQH